MKMFSYKFSNLLGAPYSCSHAHVSFDRRGSCLFVPSSNRVCRYTLDSTPTGSGPIPTPGGSESKGRNAFDVHAASSSGSDEGGVTAESSRVTTYPFEARVDISHFCVRSDGLLAISIDIHGQGLVINLAKGTILNRIRFRSNTSAAKLKWKAEKNQHFVAAAAFSPDDVLFAIACGRTIQLWHSPSAWTRYQLHLLHSFTLHQQPITCLSWSPDSLHLVSGSQDCTVRLWRARGKWGERPPSAPSISASQEKQETEGSARAAEGATAEGGAPGESSTIQDAEQAYREAVDTSFVPSAFLSHRHELKFVCFSTCLTRIYSVNREGCLIVWVWQSLAEAEEEAGEDSAAAGGTVGRNPGIKNAARPINPDFFQQRREAQRRGEQHYPAVVGCTKNLAVPADEFIDYSRGVWKMEQKAYCNQQPGQRVSHAATNISPFYKYSAETSGGRGGSKAPPQYLLVGFTGGMFQLYTLPDLGAIVKLSLGVSSLDSVSLSYDGEWVAAAAAENNTLVVWEWRSETYVLRQQNPRHGLRCVVFSPAADASGAGTYRVGGRVGTGGVAQQRLGGGASGLGGGTPGAPQTLGLGTSRGLVGTGSIDGLVKLWDAESGFCLATFAAHAAAVSALCFSPTGNAVFSASLDGTVRAFDILRLKPFRVYTAASSNHASLGSLDAGGSLAGPLGAPMDSGVQFTCVAIDAGGELLVAGSQGSCFSAFVWSVRTAKLLEELTGHEAPVVSVAFHPHPDRQGLLATGSWDKSVKVWDILGRRSRGGAPETLLQSGGVQCLAFEPQGRGMLAVGGDGGKVSLWDVDWGEEGNLSTIECLRDIQGGRRVTDRVAKNAWATKEKKRVMGLMAGLDLNCSVSTLCFSPSGSSLLIGSLHCPKVFLYDIEAGTLTAAFLLTSNCLLEGIFRELNSKYIADDGTPIQEYDLSDEEDNFNEGERERKRIRSHRSLPGVMMGDLAAKNDRVFLVHAVAFSGDSRSFAVATSHGLYIYSIDLQGGLIGNYGITELGSTLPFLTRNVTMSNISKALAKEEFAKAFLFALVANNLPTLLCVYEKIPASSVPLVCSSLSPALLPSLLLFLQTVLSPDVQVGTRHLQFHLLWLSCLLKLRMHVFQGELGRLWAETNADKSGSADHSRAESFTRLSRISVDLRTLFLLLLRQLQQQHANLHATFASNLGTLSFLTAAMRNRRKPLTDSTACSA